MRLEITIDGGKPFYFPLSKEHIVIGSSSSADIKIPQMHVSRKHLSIYVVGEQIFAEDMGSTNGSFLNDVRLGPHQKVELTSFFPIRIGSVVFIALASDEELEATDPNLAAAAASAAVAAAAKRDRTMTTTRVINREEALAPEAAPKKAVKHARSAAKSAAKKETGPSGRLQVGLLVAGLLGAGLYFYSEQQKKEQQALAAAQEQAALAAKARATIRAPRPANEIFSDEDFLSRSEMDTTLARVKCVTEQEQLFCASVDGAREDKWGATEVDEQMVIVTDGTPYYDQAKNYLPIPDDVKKGTASVAGFERYEDDLWKLASAVFVKQALTKLPYDRLKEQVLVFGLFHRRDGLTRLGVEFVGQANQFQAASAVFGEEFLNQIASGAPSALPSIGRFYLTRSSELQ